MDYLLYYMCFLFLARSSLFPQMTPYVYACDSNIGMLSSIAKPASAFSETIAWKNPPSSVSAAPRIG